jgi:DNA gyrase/topoisomerase IV subunit A
LVDRGYTDLQAKAILDMRLSKLANLGYQELLIEKKAVEAELAKLELILTDRTVFLKTMSDWVNSFAGKDVYKGECKIIQSELIKVQKAKTDTFYLTITNKIAKVTAEQPKGKNVLIGSGSKPIYLLCGADVIPVKNADTPSYGNVHGVVDKGEVIHFSKDGYVKKTSAENLITARKSIATKMEDVIEAIAHDGSFVITTNKNRKIKLESSSIKLTARGTKGTRAIKLEDGEHIIKVEVSKK